MSKKIEWLLLRKRKIPIISPAIYYFTKYDKTHVGFELGQMYHIIDEGWLKMVLEKRAFESAASSLMNQTLKNDTLLEERRKESKEIASTWLRFCHEELISDVLEKDSEEKLCEKISTFFRYYEQYSCSSVPYWFYMVDAFYKFVRDKVKHKITGDGQEEVFTKLASPNMLTYINMYEQSFLELLFGMKKSFGSFSALSAKELFKKISSNESILARFNKLIETYFWIPFDYVGPELYDKEHTLSRLLKEGLVEDVKIKEKITEIEEHIKLLAVEQEKLAEKYDLSENELKLFNHLKTIAILQDEKKAFTTEAHYYFQELLKEIAKRKSLDFKDLYFLIEEEFGELLLGDKEFTKNLIERKAFSITSVTTKEVRTYVGEDAKKLVDTYAIPTDDEDGQENVTEIKGQIASVGKVRAKAKILFAAREIEKLNEGDILVTTMTTPDFVPAMKKASAIITDEGGITSHAAIVSRELKIPCIIGTQIATKVLKDGDLVEVDANKGIVKILKKS